MAQLKSDSTVGGNGSDCLVILSYKITRKPTTNSLTANENLISEEFIEGDNLVISDGETQAYELIEGGI